MSWLSHLWWWIEVHTGTVNEAGPYYGFFSGFGSDIGEVTILAGVIAVFRQHNCHVRGCWRLKKHPVEGTPYWVCRKHHPTIDDAAPTLEQVHTAHRRHRAAS